MPAGDRSKLFQLGKLVEIDKDNATHGTRVGQFLVVLGVSPDKLKADFAVFDTKEDAEAAGAHAEMAARQEDRILWVLHARDALLGLPVVEAEDFGELQQAHLSCEKIGG